MEELTSKLGFDASQALDTLRELDGVLAKFEKTVGGTGKGLGLFNKQAGKTVGALKRIKSEADRAFASLDRVNRARGTAGPAAGATGTAGSVRSEADAVLAHLANVKAKFAEIPAAARTQHKRAFQSAATKVAEYAKRSGKSLNDVRRIQNNLGQSFTGAENKIADGLQRVEKSYGKLGETGARSTKSLTVSWETLARVVATQMIVRALSMVRNALGDAYNDSIDFQRQIAEIRTISPIKNLNQLAATVRGLSDEFNQPLGDVSEGLYQVISNQILGTANQVDVLTTSLKFSKVAVASTEDSVNLLTGTLNAFGMDASESDTIAAKFFKTIELGRTRASELAVSFGRTAPMAAQLGISLDELQASYAAVTIGGVKTAEAATQISSWFLGLIDDAGYTALADTDTYDNIDQVGNGWDEFSDYTDAGNGDSATTRPAWPVDAASTQSITNSLVAVFDMTGPGTVKGLFLVGGVANANLKGNHEPGGTLWVTALFAGGGVVVQNGDQLKITYTVSA